MNIDQAANLADSFGIAAERCLEARPLPGGKFQMLAVPAVVCAAFSVELGLKTLILLRGDQEQGHDLDTLFLALAEEDQTAVVDAMGAERATVLRSLSKARKAFEEWRYVFEKRSAAVDIRFLQSVGRAIRTVVAARRQ